MSRHPLRRNALATSIAMALAAWPAVTPHAASCTWGAPATGNWATATNWLCGIVPGAGDDATIGLTKTVTIDTTQAIRSLGNAGNLNLDAFLLTLGGTGGTTNTGTITIGGPSTAALQVSAGHNINNTGALISIGTGSVLNQFGSTITGGTIGGSGNWMVFGSGANFASDVTLDGRMDMTSNANSRQRITGALTFGAGGRIDIANGGVLSMNGGTQGLLGTGTVNLDDASARLALEGSGTTTIGSSVVVRGQGNIGQPILFGGTHTLANTGRISADVSAGVLSVVPGGGSGGVTNTGLMDARNGGVLQISSVGVTNTGGVIDAKTGSVVVQSNSTISGGTISSAGTGVFRADSGGNNFLDNVTLAGVIDMTTTGNSRDRVTGNLTFTAGSRVDIANGGILSMNGGTQALLGTGTVNLNDAGARLALESSGTTTISAGVQVRGQGNIGQALIAGGTHNLVNAGRISADVSGGTLNIVPGAGGGGVTNNGVLEAINGGTLLLSANVSGGPGGQIAAGVGSSVVQNGVTISGVINTSGSGVFGAAASGSNILSGVTLNGTVDLTQIGNSRERIQGGLTMAGGTFNIANGGILSIMPGDQTLAGNGVFNLNDAGARFALEGTSTTTIGPNILIRGQGNIGQAAIGGGTHDLVNNGRISADVNGGTLNIVPGAGGGGVTNNGVLEAINGGTLLLSANVNGGPGGQIAAGVGSSVVQNGATISGVINTSGSGVFAAAASGSNILSGVTLNGTIDLSQIGSSRERIQGGLTMTGGTFNIANGGILSIMPGDQTLAGNGVFNLNDAGARFALEGTSTTTIGPNVVIRGQGNLGQAAIGGGAHNLVNTGRISADAAGGTLSVVAGGGSGAMINRGLMDARGGGTLQFSSVGVDNAGAVIDAQDASVVLQSTSTITGGTISRSGSGVFRVAASGGNVLDSVTLSGVIDMTTVGSSRERISNNLTFAGGRVDIGNGGALSMNGGTQALLGTGTINLNDPGARYTLEGNGTTTIGAGVVVRGEGNIGQPIIVGGTHDLVNLGRISADVSGGTLTVVPGANFGAVINRGLMDARGGGTLQFSGGGVDNTGAVIDAQDASVVLQTTSTITGGTISRSGSGVFRASASSGNFLDSVTISGVVDMTTVGSSRERISNNLTFAGGRVDIGNGGILSMNGGAQALLGSGTINLNDAGARWALEGNGTTTIGAGVTVRGQGNIGQPLISGGTHNLINQGTILADGGALAIVPGAGSGSFTNNGLLHANGGTLNVSPVLQGSGTLRVSGTGQVNLSSGGTNATGVLDHAGVNAGSLNLGTQNLVVTGDYTNANAGSGNAFNRRANVAGSGQIRAGGDAAQVITGGSVTNGATTNATLTIGAVRVGTPTTFNYQVANAGTTGPTLRGAIQTTANGGNLTDPRLSGTGVTASNYNAGAPGGSSGDLAVTFATATPGAIAPLTGQKLNLRSNFENIPDQTLNIVVGAGAGAYVPATGNATASVTLPNQRVGGTASSTLTVTNTASGPSGFVEDLKAFVSSVAGLVTGSGTIVNRQAGTSGTGSGTITVGVNTATAGNQSGTVNLQYRSQGTVAGTAIPGLAEIDAGTQGVAVSGKVYQPATGQIVTAPLNFGTVQVGQVVSQSLVIGNTATGASGFVEDLNAAFGSATDTRISGTGSIAGVRGGTTSATTGTGGMTVAVDTSAVGAVSGSIRVNYTSAGAVAGVTNGLGLLARGGDDYAVTGNIEATVIATAKPVTNGILSPSAVTVNLGNLRIGTAASQSLSVLNQAVGGDQAQLKGTISGTGAPVSTAGSITALLPGATSTAMSIGVSGAAPAGPIGGGATISWISDASNIGGCGTTCELGLPSQAVNLAGAVYRLAQPQISTGTVTIAARVGDSVAASRPVTITNVSPDIYTEGLKATVSGATGNAQHNAGSIANLAAGGTDATSIRVGLASTATPGTGSGSVQLAFVSTGAGTTGAPDIAATTPSGTIDVQSRIYTPATGSAAGRTVDFGTVRVGDTVAARNVTVTNTAAATALNDTLRADLSTIGGPVLQGGSPITGLGAGAAAAFSVGLNTAAAGLIDRSGTIAYRSQNPDMTDVSGGGDEGVRVLATINNLANADFDQLSGAGVLTQSGTDYVLDLGTITLGGGFSVVLGLDNDVAGPADALTGSFDLSGADDFGYSGWGPIATALAAGEGIGGLTVNFTALGAHEDTIVFNGLGINPSDPTGLGQVRRLLIRANVVDGGGGPVPEPGTLALILGAAAGALVARRRRERLATH